MIPIIYIPLLAVLSHSANNAECLPSPGDPKIDKD